MQWQVGNVKITKLVEMETVGSTRFILPAATNDEIRKLPWLIPQFATEEGRLKMSIHSLVVETPSRRIVVDTGLGNDKQGRGVPVWNNRDTPFLEIMAAAGFPRTASTPCCAPIFTSITSAGTQGLSGANGCRRSPARATCSARPNMNIGVTIRPSRTRSRCSTIP